MKLNPNFPSKHSLSERRAFFSMLAQLYDSRIPILIRTTDPPNPGTYDLFLSKASTTLYQLVMKIKKKIAMGPRTTVYLFCQGRMLSPHAFLSQLYEKYKAEDGFLYLELASAPALGLFN